MTGRCHTCGAPVIRARKDDGAIIELEAKPHTRGTWLLLGTLRSYTARDMGESLTGATRYLPHQATCGHPSRGVRR